MKRRRVLLAAAAATAGGMARPSVAGAAVPSTASPAFLVHGRGSAWIVGPGPAQALPAAVPPVATAEGAWAVDAAGVAQRWRAVGQVAGRDRPDRSPVPPPAWAVDASHATGEPVHALAASADGAWVLLAHGERATLLDAGARPVRTYDGSNLERTRRSRAQALFAHAGRSSLIATWPAMAELWEIQLDPSAPPIFDGLVHDWRMGEALPSPGFLGVRRVALEAPPAGVVLADPRVPWVAGLSDGGVAVLHLDVRRRVATLAIAHARPQASALPAAGRTGPWWLPAGDAVHVVDTARWRVESTVPAPAGLVTLADADAAVWALAEDGLLRWQSGHWQTVASLDAAPVALARDRLRGQWLVAVQDAPGAASAAVLRLDDQGRTLARVPLPAAQPIEGLAALG